MDRTESNYLGSFVEGAVIGLVGAGAGVSLAIFGGATLIAAVVVSGVVGTAGIVVTSFLDDMLSIFAGKSFKPVSAIVGCTAVIGASFGTATHFDVIKQPLPTVPAITEKAPLTATFKGACDGVRFEGTGQDRKIIIPAGCTMKNPG